MKRIMRRALRGSDEARTWWRNRVLRYETPFFAKADNRLPPTALDISMPGAKVFSIGFESGMRHYCFESQKQRDQFLTLYRKNFGAQPVGKDPCP